MPKKHTPDWAEEVVNQWADEIVGPEAIGQIIDYYAQPAKTEEGRERIREAIEEHVLPTLVDSFREQLRYHWTREEENPKYYRRRAEDYLAYVFENWETHPGPSEVADALGISESYARYLRWLIRRAGFEV